MIAWTVMFILYAETNQPECNGVLSTGVYTMLTGNRVNVGLTRSAISSFAPISIAHHGSEKKTVLMAVSPPGILGFTHDCGPYRPDRLLLTGPISPLFPD